MVIIFLKIIVIMSEHCGFLVALFCVCILYVPYAKIKKTCFKLLYLFVIVSAGFIICAMEKEYGLRCPWCFEVGMVGFFFSICGFEYRNNVVLDSLNNTIVSVLLIILGFMVGRINHLYMLYRGFDLQRIDMLLLNYGLIPLFLLSAICINIGLCNLWRQVVLYSEDMIKKRHVKMIKIKPFCFIGQNSILIMMFHIYIIDVINRLLFNNYAWVVFIMTVILSSMLAYLIIRFIPFIYDMDKLRIKGSISKK